MKNIQLRDFPEGVSGKESACQCRRHKFDPWSGGTPPAEEQLSLCVTTIKPVLWSRGTATAELMRCNY